MVQLPTERGLGPHEIIAVDGNGAALHAIPINRYPSGEPLVNWNQIPKNGIKTLLVRQQNMDAFMTTLFLADAIAERGGHVKYLMLPFVPGARQDRKNDQGDYLFTIKYVAKLINEAGFDQVKVIDPHSEVTPALIDRCEVVHADECFPTPMGAGMAVELGIPLNPVDWSAVIAPDEGSIKRASRVARKLGIPVVYGYKLRDVRDGSLTGFGLQDVPEELKSKPLLIVDDICDGGGTFLGLSGEIAKQDCKADLYVTHGIFSKGVTDLLNVFGRVITTDTVLNTPPGVEVFDICAQTLKGA